MQRKKNERKLKNMFKDISFYLFSSEKGLIFVVLS